MQYLLLFAFFFLGFSSAFGQLSVQSLTLASYGKLPRAAEEKAPAYYNHLSIEFRREVSQSGWLLAGLRLQNFASPELNKYHPALNEDYNDLSQRYAEAGWSWGRARAGHSFAIFGRGIVLRGFELPGFVYEDQILRERHSVTRDLDGWKLTLSPGPLNVMALSGVPVNPLVPPSDERRRSGKLGGAQVSLRLPGGLEAGAAYLELRDDRKTVVATRFLKWSLAPMLSWMGWSELSAEFFGEYATAQGRGAFGKLDLETPHALYLSGALTFGAWGASVEYKDYRDFALGINDPPSLVRENAEVLLNRATHVLLQEAEKGVQVELSFAPRPKTRVTANLSEAKNDFGPGLDVLRYKDRYLAFEWLGDPFSAKLFVDGSRDDIRFETERLSGGLAADYYFRSGVTLGGDLQWQKIRRLAPSRFDYHFTNFYAAMRLQGWKNFSGFVNVERSTDPFEAATVEYWPGAGIGWQPIPAVDLQFFAGKRRGGPVCDHGYCLEVLPFEGMELRVSTRW